MTRENETIFTKRLRSLMEEHGDSPKDLTAKAGIPYNNVSYWLNYGQWPRIDGLMRVAKHYGVSTDWLLGLSDTRTTSTAIPRCQAPRCMMYAGDNHGFCMLHKIHVNGGDYCSSHVVCKYKGETHE